MKETFEIYFENLDETTQEELLEFLGLEKPEDGNLDTFAVAVVSKPEE